MSDTLQTQLARYQAINEAPEHQTHCILGHRVDTFKDEETGAYIAVIAESMTQGQTPEEAAESAKCIMLAQADWWTKAAGAELAEKGKPQI